MKRHVLSFTTIDLYGCRLMTSIWVSLTTVVMLCKINSILENERGILKKKFVLRHLAALGESPVPTQPPNQMYQKKPPLCEKRTSVV